MAKSKLSSITVEAEYKGAKGSVTLPEGFDGNITRGIIGTLERSISDSVRRTRIENQMKANKAQDLLVKVKKDKKDKKED
jgi:hypothetical protein